MRGSLTAGMLLWSAAAQAAGEAEILAAIEAIAPLRSLRLAEAPPEIPPDEYARAARGEIVTGLQAVEGYSARKAYGVGVISVPIERAWAAVNDEIALVGFTKVTYSEIVSGARCESGRSVLQFLPVPVIADRWWITRLRENAEIGARSAGAVRELAWTSSVDPAEITSAEGRAVIAGGTPLAFTRGGWLFGRVDAASTFLEYYVWTDPGGRVPAGPASMFAAGGITETFEAIEGLANAGTFTCPIR